jgi:hypothetical protein
LPSIIVSDKGLRYGVAKYFSRKLNWKSFHKLK